MSSCAHDTLGRFDICVKSASAFHADASYASAVSSGGHCTSEAVSVYLIGKILSHARSAGMVWLLEFAFWYHD